MRGVHAECRISMTESSVSAARRAQQRNRSPGYCGPMADDSLGDFAARAGAVRHGVLRSMQRAAQSDSGMTSATTIKAPWAALVVDDDAGVRQSLRLCLEAAGARVLGVATGRGALEALDRGHFDVVFLDLWLGAEVGLDLLPQMIARQSDLGVIVVTAFASIESAVKAVKRGAVDYVPKPFTPDQVRLAAGRVVEAQDPKR